MDAEVQNKYLVTLVSTLLVPLVEVILLHLIFRIILLGVRCIIPILLEVILVEWEELYLKEVLSVKEQEPTFSITFNIMDSMVKARTKWLCSS